MSQESPNVSSSTRAFRGAGVVYVGQILTMLLQFVAQRYMMSMLSKEDFGVYTYLINTISVVLGLVDAGMYQVILRDVALYPDRQNEYLSVMFFTRLAGVLLMISVVVPIMGITYSIAVIPLTLFSLSYSIVGSRTNFLRGVFDIPLRLDYRVVVITIFAVLDALLFVVGIYVFTESDIQLQTILLIQVLAASPGFIVIFFLGGGTPIIRTKVSKVHFKSVLSSLVPVVIQGLLMNLHVIVDINILRYLSGDANVGIFGAAMSSTLPFSAVYTALVAVFSPMITSRINSSSQEIGSFFMRILGIFVTILLVGVALVIPNLDIVITLLTKNTYATYKFSFALSVLSIVFILMAQLAFMLSLILSKRRILVIGSAMLLLVSTFASFPLVKMYNADGLLLSKSLSNLIAFFLMMLYLRDYIPVRKLIVFTLKTMSILCIILAGSYLFYIGSYSQLLTLFGSGVLSICVILLSYFFKLWNTSDIRIMLRR